MDLEHRLKEEWSKLQAAAVQLQAFCQNGIDDRLGEKDYQALSDLVSYITSQTFLTSQLWSDVRKFVPQDYDFPAFAVSAFSSPLVHPPTCPFPSHPTPVVPVPQMPKFEPALDAHEVAAAMAELDKGPWTHPTSTHLPQSTSSSAASSSAASSSSSSFHLSVGPSIVKPSVYCTLINRARRQRKGKVAHPRLQKLCTWCQTDTTPEWRTGPDDCILCNACGLQFRNKKKVEEDCKKKNNITNLLN